MNDETSLILTGQVIRYCNFQTNDRFELSMQVIADLPSIDQTMVL